MECVPLGGPVRPPPGSRLIGRVGWLLGGCGFALLPWLYVLATGLPDTATAAHWPVAWVGLDALEAAGLIAAGVLAAAAAMALGAELPLAALCGWLALRAPGPPRRHSSPS